MSSSFHPHAAGICMGTTWSSNRFEPFWMSLAKSCKSCILIKMSIAELGARQIFPRFAELRRPRGHQVFQCKWKCVPEHIIVFKRFKLRVVNLENFQMRRLKRLFDNPLYKCNFFNATHVCSILSISFNSFNLEKFQVERLAQPREKDWCSESLSVHPLPWNLTSILDEFWTKRLAQAGKGKDWWGGQCSA